MASEIHHSRTPPWRSEECGNLLTNCDPWRLWLSPKGQAIGAKLCRARKVAFFCVAKIRAVCRSAGHSANKQRSQLNGTPSLRKAPTPILQVHVGTMIQQHLAPEDHCTLSSSHMSASSDFRREEICSMVLARNLHGIHMVIGCSIHQGRHATCSLRLHILNST